MSTPTKPVDVDALERHRERWYDAYRSDGETAYRIASADFAAAAYRELPALIAAYRQNATLAEQCAGAAAIFDAMLNVFYRNGITREQFHHRIRDLLLRATPGMATVKVAGRSVRQQLREMAEQLRRSEAVAKAWEESCTSNVKAILKRDDELRLAKADGEALERVAGSATYVITEHGDGAGTSEVTGTFSDLVKAVGNRMFHEPSSDELEDVRYMLLHGNDGEGWNDGGVLLTFEDGAMAVALKPRPGASLAAENQRLTEENAKLREVVDSFPHSEALCLIANERRRQVQDKGYTPEHDDQHVLGEIADCAGIIALGHVPPEVDAEQWPCARAIHVKGKYTGDRIRQLSIAGAMIVAEIERLQRAACRSETALQNEIEEIRDIASTALAPSPAPASQDGTEVK